MRGRKRRGRKRRRKGKRGEGRRGRGKKNREERAIFVECPSECGQYQRETESIMPSLLFLRATIRENKEDDDSKVSSLGDH